MQNDKRSGYGTVKTVAVFFDYETVKTTVAKTVPLFCGYKTVNFIMVALCNRETIYIFMLWFVLSFFFLFFPRLISAAADWMSAILPHMVWP